MSAVVLEESIKLPEGFREPGQVLLHPAKDRSDARLKATIKKIQSVKTEELLNNLGEEFIFHEDIAKIIARAMRTGKNVILWGPPGHAKSAMVVKALESLGLREDTFVLDFGEGMDEPTLWGGLNFKRLHEEHVLDFNPERSFLNFPIVVFEELFDAPPQVLCALKNSLTAKCLYKSDTPFAMKTRVIIACTNKSPEEIAQQGESARALIERFPLQHKVVWPDYSASSYAAMFDKLGFTERQFSMGFSEIIAQAGRKDAPISPRTAMHAYQIVTDSANERGMNIPDAEALSNLKYVPGLEKVGDKMAKEYAEQMFKQQAQHSIDSAIKIIESIKDEIDIIIDPAELMNRLADLSSEEEELSKLQYPQDLQKDYQAALKGIQSMTEDITKKMTKLAMHSRKDGGDK